jgi:hypothetical protein
VYFTGLLIANTLARAIGGSGGGSPAGLSRYGLDLQTEHCHAA